MTPFHRKSTYCNCQEKAHQVMNFEMASQLRSGMADLKDTPMRCYSVWRGELAQMVERSLSMREVRGSMPRFSRSTFASTTAHETEPEISKWLVSEFMLETLDA